MFSRPSFLALQYAYYEHISHILHILTAEVKKGVTV